MYVCMYVCMLSRGRAGCVGADMYYYLYTVLWVSLALRDTQGLSGTPTIHPGTHIYTQEHIHTPRDTHHTPTIHLPTPRDIRQCNESHTKCLATPKSLKHGSRREEKRREEKRREGKRREKKRREEKRREERKKRRDRSIPKKITPNHPHHFTDKNNKLN